jgi:hypothetical protein
VYTIGFPVVQGIRLVDRLPVSFIIIERGRWKIRLHPWKRGFRRGRETGADGELLFPSPNRRNAAQGFLMPDLIAVRLFLIGNHHRRTEQAVSDTVSFSCPGHTVIDDVGVDGAVLSDLRVPGSSDHRFR